jgi:predicted aconitase with swiveling domain
MELKGRTISRGTTEAEALTTTQPISFYGGVDPETSEILEKGHELQGKQIKGKVLVFPTGKGSTVGSYTLYRLKKGGGAPAAIVNRECETVVAVGAIISEIPCVDQIDISQISTGDTVRVENGVVTVKK